MKRPGRALTVGASAVALLVASGVARAEPDAVQTTPTSIPDAATPAAPPILPPGATVEQMQAAVEAIVGPTTDAFAEFAGVAPFPAGIPTPPGTFLSGFSLQYIAAQYIGQMDLVLTAPVADVVAQFQAGAATLGMTLDEDVTASDDDSSLRELQYSYVAPDGQSHLLVFRITDAADEDSVHIQFEGSTTPELAQFTTTWTTAVPAGGAFAYGTIDYAAGTDYANVAAHYDFNGIDAAILKEQAIATLPANGFSYDAAADSDPTALAFVIDPAVTSFTEAGMTFRTVDQYVDVGVRGVFEVSATAAPEVEATVPTLGTATTTTVASSAPVSTEAPLFAPAIPAGATTIQLRDLFVGILGSTTDAAAEFSPFVPVMAGIPTPADAVVTSFSLNLELLESNPYYDARIRFTTATAPADLTTMYDTALTGIGLVQTSQATSEQPEGTVTAIEYERPDPDAAPAPGVIVSIIDGETDAVALRITDAAPLESADNIFPAISATALMPAGGVPDSSASIQTPLFGSGIQFGLSATYPVDEATLRSQVEAALTGAGYTIAQEGLATSFTQPDGASGLFSYYADGGETSLSVLYTLPLT